MQVEDLRAALHDAVERIIDAYVETVTRPAVTAESGDEGIDVVGGDGHGAFTYRWPGGDVEKFTTARVYTVLDRGQQRSVVTAWTEREAWGRMRMRAVIFGARGGSLYPWTEFVGTDDGRFAAGIPDPDHPRALLKDGAAIPDGFDTASVVRTDELFDGVRHGPSLRLVLGPEDELGMVRHGYWVACLRGRL